MDDASLPHDDGNPFQSPAPPLPRDGIGDVGVGSPFAKSRETPGFGGILNRAFNSYMTQWSAWIVPMLLSALIAIACYIACFFPFLLAQGPLACGLYMCAFRNLRNWPVDNSGLSRGWEVLGSAMLAGLALMLLQMAPVLLFALIAVPAFVLFGVSMKPGNGPGDGAAALFFIFFIAAEFIFIFAMMAWNFWINTKTMFVMPLIADRGYGFSAAFSESWRATRFRFWERLLLSFLAMLIGMIGMYACYVGALFTMPLYFLIVAAAYEDEFGIESVPGGQSPPR